MTLTSNLGFVLARRLASETTLEGALKMVLTALLEIPGIDGGGVYRYDRASQELSLVAHQGLSPTFIAKVSRYVGEQDPHISVPAKGAAIFSWDTPLTEPLTGYVGKLSPDVRAEGLTAAAVVPVLNGHELVAVFNAASRTLTSFDEPTRAALVSLAALAGDVIARVEAQHALEDNRKRLELALRAAGTEVYELDLEHYTLHLGPVWSALLPPAAPPTGDPTVDMENIRRRFIHPDDVRQVVELSRRALADGVPIESEHRVLLRDGSTRWVRIFTVPSELKKPDGTPRRMVGILQDITERRALRASAMQADRLGALGKLAAGVAHEINNPLAYVVANLDFALEHLQGGDPDVVAALREARAGASNVREIAFDLRTLARPADEEVQTASLAEGLRKALNLTRNEVSQRARLVLEIGDLPVVDGSESRLSQVFLNLILNALHALPQDGSGVLGVRAFTVGDRGCVEIRDNGTGMSKEVAARIFEPFFTTKGKDEGTGLGLSICQAIVTAKGGEIQVETEPGKGSLFRVWLPRSRRASDVPAKAPAAAQPVTPARRRILVVDDEAFVANAVRRVLRAHDVDVAIGGDEAARRLQASARYDVVLCDLMMPGMDGPGLYDHIRSRFPELVSHMVFMTGGAFTERARSFVERVEPFLIHKPFDAVTLRDAVARAAEALPV